MVLGLLVTVIKSWYLRGKLAFSFPCTICWDILSQLLWFLFLQYWSICGLWIMAFKYWCSCKCFIVYVSASNAFSLFIFLSWFFLSLRKTFSHSQANVWTISGICRLWLIASIHTFSFIWINLSPNSFVPYLFELIGFALLLLVVKMLHDFYSLFRKVGSPQAAKLLTPSLDDSNKKSTLGVSSLRILVYL